MSPKLQIERTFGAPSVRVTCVDLHSLEPWILVSLFNGNVNIWNYNTQQLMRKFKVGCHPVRTAKFIPRLKWIVAGLDHGEIKVFNYETLELVEAIEPSPSCSIMCIAVHPQEPIVLTGGFDKQITLWNWKRNGLKRFGSDVGHVMQILFNPKDHNKFASACLDGTIKLWELGSVMPVATLEGHQKGVNCIDYYEAGASLYLISGADDGLVKIWDCQNNLCTRTFEAHTQGITAIAWHPELAIIFTASCEGTVKVWRADKAYKLQKTIVFGRPCSRVWSVCCPNGSSVVGIGHDEGAVLMKLSLEEESSGCTIV